MVPEMWQTKAGADPGSGCRVLLSCPVLETDWSPRLALCLLWEHVYIDRTGPLQNPFTHAKGPAGRGAL